MRTTLLLDLAADSCGERIAIGSLEGGVSFERLRAGARAAGADLAAGSANNLAFVGQNGAAVPLAFYAAGYAGMPFVPLNYRLKDAELRRLLERSAPCAVVVDDEMAARVEGVADVEVILRSEFELRYLSEGAEDPGEPEEQFDDPGQDIAVLLFTSGTTGDPKAAVLRHANLTSYVMATVEFLGSDEDEAALVSVPPYHIAGISAILTSAYGGRRIVYLPQFDATEWVAVAAREGITHAMVVPTMLDRILDAMAASGEILPALRALSYGGGRMPEPVIARAMALLPHVAFVNAYGLTETSSTVALLDADDHRAAFASDDPAVRRRLGSVGKPLPSLELEIRDPEGQPCGPGQSGEIHVRGDQVSGEYLAQEGDRRRRLVRDQRRRLARRGRLPVRRRAARRRDRARRREHLAGRDRGRAARASVGRRRRGAGPALRPLGREGRRCRGLPRRH